MVAFKATFFMKISDKIPLKHIGGEEMTRTELIQMLRNYGMDRTAITDLFLYCLITEDRQAQLLEWIKENHETCDQASILREAQRLLNTYLSKNPYNIVTKDTPIPKWTPPKEDSPPAPPTEPLTISPAELVSEDPFDKVLQAFFEKTR